MIRPINPGYETQSFSIQSITADEVDDSFLRRWKELADRSLEPNAFLEPAFVLPALRHLTPEAIPRFLVVESSGSSDLLGLGIFQRSAPSRRMPLEYLQSYRCPHTFLSGMLVDSGCADSVMHRLLEFLCQETHGVEFRQLAATGEQGKLLFKTARNLNLDWHEYDRYDRGLLKPAAVQEETYLDDVLSPKRRKAVRKSWRRLEREGNVELVVHRGTEVGDHVVDTFLRMENQGWKANVGSSLASQPSHERFFREMVSEFAKDDQAIFTELHLEGKPIASTCNFVSGSAGFAFKVCFERSLEKFSPGILHETAVAAAARRVFGDLQYVDSCSESDSFIQKLWPDRRTVVSGLFSTTGIARVCATTAGGLRTLRQRLGLTAG